MLLFPSSCLARLARCCIMSGTILVFIIMLTACGFHLQGKMELAPRLHRIYVQTLDPYGPLARYLKDSLRMSHAQIMCCPQEASAVLVILQDMNSQKLLNVNSTTQTRQYLLKVIVTFEINTADGRIILPPQTLEESRVMTIQSNQILGSSNESNLFYQQMRRILAAAIMNRISSRDVTKLLNMYRYE